MGGLGPSMPSFRKGPFQSPFVAGVGIEPTWLSLWDSAGTISSPPRYMAVYARIELAAHPWQGCMLATTPIDQLKSVKDSSYLRPRIPIRLNFTYITSALPLYSQVTTYTEPFTVFRHSLGPYRTRTCDLRLYADALTHWANRPNYHPSTFLFVETMGIEPISLSLQGKIAKPWYMCPQFSFTNMSKNLLLNQHHKVTKLFSIWQVLKQKTHLFMGGFSISIVQFISYHSHPSRIPCLSRA